MPLQPPVPFADFEFAFDPSLSNLFPHPPPLPSPADLFSPSETTDLLGFLDNFGDLNWDFPNGGLSNEPYISEHAMYEHVPPPSSAPYSNPHLGTAPEQSTSSRAKGTARPGSKRGTQQQQSSETSLSLFGHGTRDGSLPPRSSTSESSNATTPTFSADPSPSTSNTSTSTSNTTSNTTTITNTRSDDSGSTSAAARTKPLLSTPQKRLNHIMSEQKRRNAIRDGYAQLIALMAPAGSAPGLGMPTRGRPKGSGSRGKGQSKGKSGVLFRAVEYCRWLEEGREALAREVEKVETAAGIRQA